MSDLNYDPFLEILFSSTPSALNLSTPALSQCTDNDGVSFLDSSFDENKHDAPSGEKGNPFKILKYPK